MEEDNILNIYKLWDSITSFYSTNGLYLLDKLTYDNLYDFLFELTTTDQKQKWYTDLEWIHIHEDYDDLFNQGLYIFYTAGFDIEPEYFFTLIKQYSTDRIKTDNEKLLTPDVRQLTKTREEFESLGYKFGLGNVDDADYKLKLYR